MFRVMLFMIFAINLRAEVPVIQVANLTITPDCGSVSPVVETDPNNPLVQCLRVYFDSFGIVAGVLGNVQRNCHMDATLKIPANTQFRATEAVAEGAFSMTNSYGGISLLYSWPKAPTPGQNQAWFSPNTAGNFQFKASIPDAALTPCLPYESEVKLSSDLHTFIDQRGQGTSLVSLDEVGNDLDGRNPKNETRRRLSWNWEIVPCHAEPPATDQLFNQTFISHYTAPNDRYYMARIFIAGSTGRYESAAGFTGELFNINRLENGQVIEGEWRAPGASGTFTFRMTDTRLGSFFGTWKDHLNRTGYWNGQYDQGR